MPILRIEDKCRYWYNSNGDFHREGGPAIERWNGSREWYFNGQRHRFGGPAIERSDGSEHWYLFGLLHRVDGPASVRDTYRAWYYLGQRHREDGPALELSNGDREWFYLNQRHRTDGPAIERGDSCSWWIRDVLVSKEEYYLPRFLAAVLCGRRWHAAHKISLPPELWDVCYDML